ncbi:MAG: hypothetical protein NTX52_04225, partial [Planctomycetota bacterium]|nr:hypothetical protein [Planctomycetota bacterium]
MMRNLFATYLVLFSAVGAGLTGGCSKPALEGPSREILAGLTIKDIEPVRSEVSLSQVGLRLVTYEMPLENLSSFEKAVGGTGSESIRFAGRKAFEANGLSVGAGPRDSWQKVWAILEKAKTERIRYENLLLFGDLSQEIGDVRIDPKEKLFGGISGSRPAEFAQGSAMLFWQLKARPSEINRSAA